MKGDRVRVKQNVYMCFGYPDAGAVVRDGQAGCRVQLRFARVAAIARPISLFVEPAIASDRIRRSSDTAGSPASIFATRDWLEPSASASAVCDKRRARRRVRSAWASATRISMITFSASLNPRNCWTVPTRQPARSSRFCLSLRMESPVCVGVAHARSFARLDQPQQEARLAAPGARKRRALYLAMQPDQRLAWRCHGKLCQDGHMSRWTYMIAAR